MTARRLFLIDGTALAYRSFFAFASSSRGGLSTSTGKPTAATYGFAMTLRALLDRESPDLCAIAFDGAREELERTRLYPEYKSTRDKAPDEMVAQFDDIQRVVAAHGIPVVSCPGQEADDVIGSLAVQGRDAGFDVFIVTGDKDFMQLVGERIRLWNLRASTRAPEIIAAEQVRERFGVGPEQMIDLLALMGDASDNIPGVPRIGQKTASQLLEKWGSLDAAIEHVDEITPPSIQATLREHVEQARLSRRLVTIRTDLATDPPARALEPPHPDLDALRALFAELEFDTLLRALPKPKQDAPDGDYDVVVDRAGLDALLGRLRAAGTFALAVEARTREPMNAAPVGIAFSCRGGVASYVPFHATPPVVAGGVDALRDALRPLLEDESIAKVVHDAKFAMHALHNVGVGLSGVGFDPMLGEYCVRPGLGGADLDALALTWFETVRTPAKELLGSGRKQKTFEDLDVDVAGRRIAEDADFTWRLRERMASDLDELGVRGVLEDIEMPLVDVLFAMEREGIRIDTGHLERLSDDYARRIRRIEERIYERAGGPFNLNSPAQIGEVLFGKLEVHRAANLRPKRTKTGQFKTDAAILEKLAAHHEVPELLLGYRQLAKLKGTYVDSLPTMVHPATGRVHTSFNQAVAATGRLSSDNPNLQNIPIRTAEGREVRKAFVSRAPGWVLVSADYSQIELRILAHITGDPALVDAFRSGDDVHARTAALVHGALPGMVTPEMRNQAKIINYGLIYGMGPSRLASETGMTPVEARKFIDSYFSVLPGVKEYLDRTLAIARSERAVRTLFGRRRPLPDIDAQNMALRVASENMAVNTPIQGTAADIVKRAMIALQRELGRRRLEAKLLLQVHDELVLDVPERERAEVESVVRDTMVGAADFAVALDVSIGHGPTWLDAH